MKNYFASFIPAVKAILGIEAWSKDADKKDALLEEQKQKLKALNFNDTFINTRVRDKECYKKVEPTA